MAVSVPGRKQLDDWTNEHLCSLDAVQARRLEDLVGRANSLDADSDLEDLRVCYAIAMQRGSSLRPSEGVFPALGVRALIGQSGDVPSTEVKVVYARNSHALQVDQAMEMMNCAGVGDLPDNSFSQTWRRSRDLIVQLPEVVSRIHRGQMARHEVSTLCLFKDGAHSADAPGFSRIEVSQPGDILPVKRGKFGFINNIQVVLAALELPPLRSEMLQLVRNASVKGRSLPEKAEERLSVEVAAKRLELADILF
jgi:hypothetical protein